MAMPFVSTARADDVGDPDAGRNIANAWCSNCHAFEGSNHATATGAPTFSAVAADPAITPLSLRVFLRTTHDRMPDLQLNNRETADLIAFILASRLK
jgi:mono/diheme cytochrome c family protein